MTTEQRAYERHLKVCEAAECGSWCRDCDVLIEDADRADYRPCVLDGHERARIAQVAWS
jgi:hypothetical protein